MLRKVMFALAVAGIAVAALSLANGGAVTRGGYSTIGPVQVGAIGVAGYLLLALLAWFRRRGWTLLFSWMGLSFAAYLTYVEAFVLRDWSAYCVISQCLIAVLAILAAVDAGMAVVRRLRRTSDMVEQAVTGLRYG